MICPNCKDENIDNSSKCKKCGKSFKEESREIKNKTQNVSNTEPINNGEIATTTCYNCNKQVDIDLEFCSNCGFPTEESEKMFNSLKECILFTTIGIVAFIFLLIPLLNKSHNCGAYAQPFGCAMEAFSDMVLILILACFEFFVICLWLNYFSSKKKALNNFNSDKTVVDINIKNNTIKSEIPENIYINRKEKIITCFHCNEKILNKQETCNKCGFPIVYSIWLVNLSNWGIIFSATLLILLVILSFISIDQNLLDALLLVIIVLGILIINSWWKYFKLKNEANTSYRRIVRNKNNNVNNLQ